jgi:hypothetical protein
LHFSHELCALLTTLGRAADLPDFGAAPEVVRLAMETLKAKTSEVCQTELAAFEVEEAWYFKFMTAFIKNPCAATASLQLTKVTT